MFLRISSGSLSGRRIRVPDADLRPTGEKVRAALFNTLFSLFSGNFDGRRFLDLFAGSGAVGIEALSRGFAFSQFMEKNKKTCQVIRSNIAETGLKEVSSVICCDSFEQGIPAFLHGCYDVIFIDPPYDDALKLDALLHILVAAGALAADGVVVVETNRDIVFSLDGFSEKVKEYGETRLIYLTHAL